MFFAWAAASRHNAAMLTPASYARQNACAVRATRPGLASEPAQEANNTVCPEWH